MKKNNSQIFIELAELARSNITGPIGKKVIADAQRKLVAKLAKTGALTNEEAEILSS